MIPEPGKIQYTPAEETPKGSETAEYPRLKGMALQGQYLLLIRELRESGRYPEEELIETEQTYNALLSFYAEGVEDPERERYHREIGIRLLGMIRRDEEEQTILRDPHHLRGNLHRGLETRGILGVSFSDMISMLMGRHGRDGFFYKLLEDLFDRIWTTTRLPEESFEPLLGLLTNENFKEAGRAVVGALFVGVMEFFDPLKVRLLVKACRQGSPAVVRGAALPSLLFAGRRHQEELLRFYPGLLKEARQIIEADSTLRELIFRCIVETHITYDTEEDHRIFMQEILPTLKNVQNLLGGIPGKDLAERLQNLSRRMDEDDEQQAELRRMMDKAVSRLTSESFRSHDIEYHNAMQMKIHPFFAKVVNWFLLFDPMHPAVNIYNAREMEKVAPMAFQGRQIVSGDLYSYNLLINWEPIARQIRQMGETVPALPAFSLTPESEEQAMRDFLFGAYRFYHLFTSRDRFRNPFSAKPYLLDGAFTRIPGLFDEEEYLRLAGILGSQRHYISAGYTYARLISEWGDDSAEAWRGLAVTNIRLGNKYDALACIDKAVADEGITGITAENKARLLSELGRKGEAVTFLEQAEAEVEESEVCPLTLLRTRLLMDMGRREEAISAAFKADYLESENSGKTRARHLLVRLLIGEGRGEEALQKVQDLPGEELYLGLALIATGKRAEGINALRDWKAARGEAEAAQGTKEIRELLPLLSRFEIPEWEQSLIFDAVARNA